MKKNFIPSKTTVQKLQYLIDQGFSQGSLGDKTGISQATISRILKKGVDGYITSQSAIEVNKFYSEYRDQLRELRDEEENEEMEFINTMVKGKRIIQFWLLVAFLVLVLGVGYVITIIG